MDERKDFTYDHVNFAGLPEYIKELQDGGMHFIIILVGISLLSIMATLLLLVFLFSSRNSTP
jgi:hypothetical protein